MQFMGFIDKSNNSFSQNNFAHVFLLQKRIFKSMLVNDIKIALQLQKVLLQSSSSRLFVIRMVTQICELRKFPGVDNKTSLTFLERFELNESLKIKVNTWTSQATKKVTFLSVNGESRKIQLFTISDRAWQLLVKLSLEPVCEATFYFNNFGFRSLYNIYSAQNFITYNLGFPSFGNQKRILKVDLPKSFNTFNKSYLLENILLPRSLKFALNRFLSGPLVLEFFPSENISGGLVTILCNILLHGIEALHDGLRFGNNLIYFLKPFHEEKKLLDLIYLFFSSRGFLFNKVHFELISPVQGFDFLGWHFRFFYENKLLVIPSKENFQSFLFRVKRIINNSNYGSNVKVAKLYPVIRDWREYHKFCSLEKIQLSMYFIRKKAFRVFSQESRQDFFSSRRLLNKCFYFLRELKKNNIKDITLLSPYNGHLFFFINNSNPDDFRLECVHCGMSIFK